MAETKRVIYYDQLSGNQPTNGDVIFVDNPNTGTHKMDLKSFVDAINNGFDSSIKSSGVSVSADNYSSIITNVNDQPVNSVYTYGAGLQSKVSNLPSNKAMTIMNFAQKSTGGLGQVMLAAERNGSDDYLYFRTIGGSPAVWSSWVKAANSADVEAVREALDNLDIETDTTLSIDGKPADAKATGDVINNVKSAINSRLDFLALEQGGIYIANGLPQINAKYVRTVTKIENPTHIDTCVDGIIIASAFVYDSEDDSYETYSNVNAKSADFTPASGKYIRLTFYKSNNNNLAPHELQPELFATRMERNAVDTDSNTKSLTINEQIENKYTEGYGINNSFGIGTHVDITPVANTSVAYLIVPCCVGDVFTLTGTGGSSYKLWCFTDEDYKLISASDASASASNLRLVAEHNGYFISNVLKQNVFSLSVKHRATLQTIVSAVDDIQSNVDDIQSNIVKMINITDKSSEFTTGYYINTNVNVGATVDITPVANTGFEYQIIPCKKDDIYVITVNGGTNSRAWAFTDSERKLLSKSVSTSVTDATLTAASDGYIILNNTTNVTASVVQKRLAIVDHETRISALESDVFAIKEEVNNVTKITDPHKLNWVMKSFSADGVGGAIYTDRMCTWCRVKAGSTVKPNVYGGNVKVSFGYKIDDSQVVLDSFTSYGYSTYTVPQDCTVFIGVVNNPATYLFNDSILNDITIDLDVIDYVSKYSKKDAGAFGNPVDVYYEGQHTDETGWTNNTVDVDAIHAAFDALMTAGDGYLTKTDLGVAYSTYHMYKYDTFPVPANSSALKVPKVAIICCEHGNEKMSVYAVHYLLHDLIHKSTKNPVLSYLRSNCKLSIIPIANPWGFINTSRWNENGVNLNRNFPTYNWSEYSDSTTEPGGINYKGTSAASETQTKMIMEFLRANYDAVFAIDLHTNGTNTSHSYEICTTIIPETTDEQSLDYAVQHSYAQPARVHVNRIKPWFDENYGSYAVGANLYGAVSAPEPDRPTTGQWIRESNNMMGFTFEVLCGSSDEYLGPTLTKYAPATIKAAAEELGNFLVAMLINCKTA